MEHLITILTMYLAVGFAVALFASAVALAMSMGIGKVIVIFVTMLFTWPAVLFKD